MAKRGPPPKPAGKSVGHRSSSIVRLVTDTVALGIPAPPDGWLDTTLQDWRVFWESPTSRVVSAESRPALIRLFRMRDDWEREYASFKEARLVKGSVGQVRLNPLAGHLLALETAMGRLEDQFGLTPLSASRLGIAFFEAQKSLEELNRAIEHPAADEDEDDPRTAVQQSDVDVGRAVAPEPRG